MKEHRSLTEAEKAALLYRFYNGVKSFEPAFAIAFPDRYKRLEASSLKSAVSHWKNSPEVQEYNEQLKAADQARCIRVANLYRKSSQAGQETGTEQGAAAGEGEEGKVTFPDNWINFQDIEQFLNFCQVQANQLQDERERQFYLKTIADLMRYKEQDTSQYDIQRFYTPLQCSNCALYLKASQGQEEK